MSSLFLITARGGSKGIPGKNIKHLGGKPLLLYSIEYAREFTQDENICLSTDSEEIKKVAEKAGLNIPFLRPDHLATDTAGSREAILHALDWYENNGKKFDSIVLLQPTSPFRKKSDLEKAFKMFSPEVEMVTSACKLKSNIQSTYYKMDSESNAIHLFLNNTDNMRRQDAEPIYELNGSIYLISVNAIRHKSFNEFNKIKLIEMDRYFSTDIDELTDWHWAEFLLEKKLIRIE